jgi:hypothetical protein
MPRTSAYGSEHLTLEQVIALRAGNDNAIARGKRLNRALHIHWDNTWFSDETKFNRRYLVQHLTEATRHWLSARSEQFLCLLTRESVSSKGEHCHLLIHVSDHLWDDFQLWIRGWLGAPRRSRAIRMSTVRANLYSLKSFNYICKGSTPDARDWINAQCDPVATLTDADNSDQGYITGKRYFISRSLRPKAILVSAIGPSTGGTLPSTSRLTIGTPGAGHAHSTREEGILN